MLAALLVGAASALLVGGCVMAAWLGGILGVGATLMGFTAYLFVFGRGLDLLAVDRISWRARRYDEHDEAAEEEDDLTEGGRP